MDNFAETTGARAFLQYNIYKAMRLYKKRQNYSKQQVLRGVLRPSATVIMPWESSNAI